MIIASTYENGMIFPHFGHSRSFKLYSVSAGAVTGTEVVEASGPGHGALAGMLKNLGVEYLICGGIGGGAVSALAAAGITVYPGVSGNPDEAVKALLEGRLQSARTGTCGSHESHACGEHSCSMRD